jgi:hypothetical protein
MSTQPVPEPTPFEKMAALAAKVISVPKEEVDRKEIARKEVRANLKKPKPRDCAG